MAKKILIIRFSSIGDIVLTTPVVRAVKQQLGAEVHFLTKKRFCSIVEVNPYVDRVYAIADRVGEVLPQLRQEGYDLIVDLHNNLRSMQVKRGLVWGTSTRANTFDKINLAKWLMVNLKIDRLPRRHIVDRYMDTVRGLGVRYDGKGLDYFIPGDAEVDPATLAADGTSPGGAEWVERLRQGQYLGLVMGAAHATKRLPVDRLQVLAGALPKPVVLLGGPDDRAAGAQVAAVAPGIFNTCGALSLHGSASLIRQAAGLITHDTGLMHIGAALGRPMVSIWGNTIPAFGMYPLFPEGKDGNTTMEVAGLSCRPCSKIGYAQCPKGHFRCMRDQSVPAIAERAAAFLDE